MKQILVDKNFNLYKKGDSPEELADKVLSAFREVKPYFK